MKRFPTHGYLPALATLLLSGAIACGPSDTHTTLVVVVESDLVVPDEIDTVEILVGAGPLRYPFKLGNAAGRQSLPVRVALVPGGMRDRSFDVQAQGLLQNNLVITQSASVSFVPGTAQQLTLFLGRSCVTSPACPDGQTCQNGSCIDKGSAGTRGPYGGGADAGAPDVPAAGTGGGVGSGGVTGSGGATASGGAPGTGGSVGTGGSGTGGANSGGSGTGGVGPGSGGSATGGSATGGSGGSATGGRGSGGTATGGAGTGGGGSGGVGTGGRGSGGILGAGGAGGGNCISAIQQAGYASGTAAPCSACVDNGVSRESACKTVIDCLQPMWPCSGNCLADCLNRSANNNVVGACVQQLTDSACNGGTGGASGTGGVTGTGPCAGLCSNPVQIAAKTNSGSLGTTAICDEVTGTITGGDCGNFLAPRTLTINGTQVSCDGGVFPQLPAKRNGGYCFQASAGQYSFAYFTTF